ncbi:hypothetical protein EYB26_004320 [Talaromyces marneffei]|uniref:uncharacterized protein n=1 Tax=Talaromyces marneffei TaxID=37727 RepID=UPI0012A8566C|nr:uncharacterized protein EYB26_004320 [Talaromyces marneffei]QGA16653.1 hypothetical protein EYB26_004320 [Talaromyces marneffei]
MSQARINFDQEWIGLKVHSIDSGGETIEWILNQKIYEKQRDFDHHGKEARAIFRSTDADDKNGSMRIRMLLDAKHLHTSILNTHRDRNQGAPQTH